MVFTKFVAIAFYAHAIEMLSPISLLTETLICRAQPHTKRTLRFIGHLFPKPIRHYSVLHSVTTITSNTFLNLNHVNLVLGKVQH